MKYYIIAGEASGDLHAANLVRQLSIAEPSSLFKGIGGEQLKNANVELLFGLERLDFMGFYEVIKNLRTIQKNFRDVKKDILSFNPDVVILIDYPGFNLRMAAWCKLHGFKVAYYISPQIWAWKEKRVEIIKKYVDLVLCILPFEESFFKKHGYENVHFVGHPLLDIISENTNSTEHKKAIALLPGSRKQEIQKLLPLMLETAIKFPVEKFIIAGMTVRKTLYPDVLPKNVSIEFDKTYDVLGRCRSAIVCSGTATLETALLNIPQIVVYKTSRLNYAIGKRIAKVKFISLPNLIADAKIVEELIQKDCTVDNIFRELSLLLRPPDKKFYQALIEKIGTKGASEKAAHYILQLAH